MEWLSAARVHGSGEIALKVAGDPGVSLMGTDSRVIRGSRTDACRVSVAFSLQPLSDTGFLGAPGSFSFIFVLTLKTPELPHHLH